MPEVSILVPTYNIEKFIGQCLNSVINQSFKNWECIVLDDCSSDNTYEKALEYSKKDSRIQVYKNLSNLGMLENWNYGIDLCQCEYFVKLDGDDFWHSDMLQRAIKILEGNKEVGLVFSKYLNVDDQNNLLSTNDEMVPQFAINNAFSCVDLVKKGADNLLKYNILRQGLSLMRRNIFDEIGKYKFLYSHDTQASTDTEFYFRLGAHYLIYQINEYLYYYRKHEESISKHDTNSGLQAKKIYETKKAIFNYYFSEGIITKSFLTKNIRKVDFQYLNKMRFSNQQKGNFYKSLVLAFKLFMFWPGEMISYLMKK